ncbi:hypothetical protein PFWH6_1562 [Pseudomonas fluorescens WH6]|nr:hypothetical protein PFWH6_1562 [Pseudomonas fluorescens WH6]
MGLVTLPERRQALKAQMRSIVCAGNKPENSRLSDRPYCSIGGQN